MSELSDDAIPHFNMQTAKPEDAIKRWECPVGRTFADAGRMCRGDKCAAWRYLPIMASDASFKGAVQREIKAMEQEQNRSAHLLHQDAVARVAADPSAYCIPSHHERGYCGLGGKP